MEGASEKWAKGSGPAMFGRAFAVLVLVMSTLAAAAAGCGADSGTPTGSGGNGTTSGPGQGGSTSSIPGSCNEGSTQPCHVVLDQHGSVITCYAGTQTCLNGLWGECQGGSKFERLLPGGGSLERSDPGADNGDTAAEPEAPAFHSLSLTDAGSCPDAGFNDPCDPTCMGFPEVPDGGILIPGTSTTSWNTGTLANLPGAVTSKGTKVPCLTGADCQFNQYCGNPSTGPTCVHSKCAPGTPLKAVCDTCVQQICAKPGYASCCSSATCAHDLCAAGAALTSGCDPCVASICATKPSCCSGTWDATCVGMVATKCGQSCAAWTPACVQQVHDVCGDVCDPAPAPCTHDLCYTGAALANNCDNGLPNGNCVASICAARPSCCSTSWDATCASMVTSTCFKQCPTQGICDSWIAGQTDPNCPKPDLTLGVPCFAQVPVCNVGTATAVPPPGGIIVHRWAVNASSMPTCTPNVGNGNDCTPVMVPIPPGQCVTTTCGALTDRDELMVNPTGTVSECFCQNNWAIYSSATGCEPAVCTGPQSTFAVDNVLMHLAVERSAATATAIPSAGTIWSQMQAGLKTFYADPLNTGTRSSLTFFPDGAPPLGPGAPPFTIPVCDTTACTTGSSCSPRVTLNSMPNSIFINALNAQFAGTTAPPASAGYDGMIRTAKPYATPPSIYSADTHIAVLILASDVANCNNTAAIATNAATILSTSKIHTYVIGIGVPATTTSTIASAGGGKSINLAVDANLGANLAAALTGIRQNIFPCAFDLPAAGLFDPSNPFLSLVSNAIPMTQTQVANLAACGPSGGYYYDNNANPTQVRLCPGLCTTYRSMVYNAVKIIIKCPTKYEPWSAPQQIYKGTCPPGTQVQWGLFGYDSTAPSDSNIKFSVQVASTQAGLATAPLIPIGSAHSIPTDTQVCPVPKIPAQVPAPTCPPIDLFNKLGGPPNARYDYLQLSMDFTPSTLKTTTPTLTDWQITYSCPADQ